ncbi:MAG: hypothetical protein LBJ67_16170 [Planctomycetaceae bacterium]|jgi:hypothetical protein|nr:hypothetical protein [Planctomycetaceae bacterium]
MNLSKNIFLSPAWGVMCITGGGAQRNRRISAPKTQSPAGTRLSNSYSLQIISPLQGFGLGKLRPAVALRSTAGYAHHTPAGLKNSEYFVGFFAWGA